MGRLAVNGLCNVEDFDDPELSRLVRELQPAVPAQSRRDRRAWEAAMTVIGLRRGGALHDDAELLCLNPGPGPLPFWLTNHVRRVFAADLYLGLVPGDPLSS